jgi:probable HAF family extracellular repeat protein
VRRGRVLTAVVLLALAGAASPATGRALPEAPAPHYRLIDLGTFGGPNAALQQPSSFVTSRGAVLGLADTTIRDQSDPSGDSVLTHAFAYVHGHLRDLGALPGNNSSDISEMNRHGLGVGESEVASLNPTGGFQSRHAVIFHHGRVHDLGTLPGGTESNASAVDDTGLIAGFADTGVPNPGSIIGPWGTDVHAIIWRRGRMHDLGTLGGPQSGVDTMNDRGQIVGDSNLDATINPLTGVPTTHPFLWQHGRMRDLGTLGGTATATNWINNRGQVVGVSTLADDVTYHPFLWQDGRIRDLGLLGGDFATAYFVSDNGIAVGGSTTAGDEAFHATMWRDGRVIDLAHSSTAGCTFADAVNTHGDVVGDSCQDGKALLWHAGHQYDLTSLVGPTGVQLTEGTWITDRGEIVSYGVLPNGDVHVFLLRPATANPTSPARPLSATGVKPVLPACSGVAHRPLGPVALAAVKKWLPCL